MAINQPAPRPNMKGQQPGGRGKVQLLFAEKVRDGDQESARLIREVAKLLDPELRVDAHAAPANLSAADDAQAAQEKHDRDYAAYKRTAGVDDDDKPGLAAGGR